MSTVTTNKDNGVDYDNMAFDFGKETVADKPNKAGDLSVKIDKSAFIDNAKAAGIPKDEIVRVFKYTKAYNEAFVKEGVKVSEKQFKDKEVKRVLVKGGYGADKTGTATVVVQREKTVPVGGLSSGKKAVVSFVSYKIKDSSLPNKDMMKEQAAALMKKIK